MAYIEGVDRSEVLLFPEALDDYITDLSKLCFARTTHLRSAFEFLHTLMTYR